MSDEMMAKRTPPVARSKFLWAAALPSIRAVGKVFFSMRVDYETELPTPPFVVAANHYSHFDAPVIGAALDLQIRFLALEDLFTANRVLEWLITGFGAIPTPRHRHPIGAVRTALAALDSGDVVGVFPEATRVSHWGIVPPKRGAAWLAVRAGVPLVPVAVVGTGRVLGLENHLRRGPIRVIVGPDVAPEGTTVEDLTEAWSKWMDARVAQYPDSEVTGPPRTQLDLM